MLDQSRWFSAAGAFAGLLWASLRDLLPIVVVIGVFQIGVVGQPLENFNQLLVGLVLVVVGMTLFVLGLEMGLFPLGQQMAHDFARRGSLFWLVAFAFALGFGTTFAEPALLAVASKAAELAITQDALTLDAAEADLSQLRYRYALLLRATVAVAVGVALVVGVIRIILGWPLHVLIMIGYLLIMVLTMIAPSEVIAVAYDSGGVTTSTVTVPLTAALGVGLASSIKQRDPLLDGFGLIAFASLTPIIFVLVLGILRA